MHALNRRAFLALSAAGLLSACASTGPIAPAPPRDPTQMTQQEIMSAINAVRGANGLAPWSYSVSLEQAARTHSNLMAASDKLSHELGGTLRERVTAAGYLGAVGENLAGGHSDIEHAIAGWLNSPGHRSTLLSDKFTEFGLAASRAPKGKLYWTLIAGGSFDPWRVWI
ncbi:CAP domain-containing protein [Devosia geojensis]|uniref:CAP domain-containing protein n=1 Tax=Devosia geojensis TaxID=443610 RepID=UPI000696A628|nr:CAP domain-containing protein [Devosia geojensis]